jgi:hypothetical protein
MSDLPECQPVHFSSLPYKLLTFLPFIYLFFQRADAYALMLNVLSDPSLKSIAKFVKVLADLVASRPC